MDKKSFQKQKSSKGPRQGFVSVPKNIPADSLVLRTSWTLAALSTGTAGEISASISSSVSNSSEFSVLSSLWREVKLVSHSIEFFFYNPYSTSGTSAVTSTLVMGTDMRMNGTTFTLPTTYLEVYNISDSKTFCRTSPRKIIFRRQVPRNLQHTNIAEDVPTLPIPYAGSPGVIQMFTTGGAISAPYTTVLLNRATYHLQGRI